MELISIDQLIKILRDKNINFGKGDPYNRLRYYTKIGWLPHMTRKKNEEGIISGHYPLSVIEDIVKIENLKSEGKNNEEITSFLKQKEEKNFNLQVLLTLIRKFNINYFLILIIILGFLTEVLKFNSYTENPNNIVSENKSLKESLKIIPEKKILDAGISFLPKNQNKIFIPSTIVKSTSLIFVNFQDNIGNNNNYFIKEIKENQGFYVETSNPIFEEAKFNWIIVE